MTTCKKTVLLVAILSTQDGGGGSEKTLAGVRKGATYNRLESRHPVG
jgi:hypothetical protein